MKSRELILKRIRESIKNKSVDLTPVEDSYDTKVDIVKFQHALDSISSEWYMINNLHEAKEKINAFYPGHKSCINLIPGIDIDSMDFDNISGPKDFNSLDIAIIKGEFGVAENGAIWIDTGTMPYRIIPFIPKALVVVLKISKLVANMHNAYQLISAKEYDYGIFIAGPSKTADIEQTLVIGAQGPIKMLVLMVR